MKIAVLNQTGNVGKTTTVAHLLAPRMPGAEVFAVETVKETAEGLGVDVSKIKGENFGVLFKKLLTLDNAIIDVGASNVEPFLNGLARFEDSYLEFDLFVVPTTSGNKEQRETLSMVATLAGFGIAPEKIRVLFNRVQADVKEEFALILAYALKEKTCIANPAVVIFENEVFDLLSRRKLTIAGALLDTTDYKSKLRSLGPNDDPKLELRYADLAAIRALAKSVNRHLDAGCDPKVCV
jgi:hypothetical protein